MTTRMESTEPLAGAGREVLALEGLVQHFTTGRSWTDRLTRTAPHVVKAVDGVDLTLAAGETLGLVGESGCGKSTLSRCVMGLYQPTAGTIRYAGQKIDGLPTRAQRRTVQMVFQDPYSSLNPRMTVGQTIAELLRYHKIVPRDQVAARCLELMDLVGLPPEALGRTPRQFSGGQRQRIGIARALALEPTVLIADEPVSALDVSVQATIINLLLDLKQTLGLSMVFVSHNMAVIRQVSDRIAVMYRGKIVETGSTADVFDDPRHPYTQLLLSSVPRMLAPVSLMPIGTADPLAVVDGEPDADESPYAAHVIEGEGSGCRFRPRCPVAIAACSKEPELLPVPTAGRGSSDRLAVDRPEVARSAACWHVEDRTRSAGGGRSKRAGFDGGNVFDGDHGAESDAAEVKS
jgi:oligopeptide/dipeptide ABC transporter ATP-binding protein